MDCTKQLERLDPQQGGVQRAAELLRAGELVAIPTETVYGLAARADREEAVAKIYRTKGRPDFNPLIVHVASLAQARGLARFDARAERLAERFWPGPLTMVLPQQPDSPIAPAVTAGLPTIALRSPAHPVARAVLEACDLPLAAPSANRSMAISPTRVDHVANSFGEAAPAILDGGPCAAGLESTIVALRPGNGWQVLRPGPIAREELAALLGPESTAGERGIEAPGQMTKHYSPGKAVRLGASDAAGDEFHIGFGPVAGDYTLSPDGDPAEAASRLYQALHEAARSTKPRIAIAPVPDEGMGEAINDRLRRAAARQ